MKIYASLLALCALQSAGAFQAPAPKATGVSSLNSYLGNLSGDEVGTAPPGTQYYSAAKDAGGPMSRGGVRGTGYAPAARDRQLARSIWEELTPVTVQGGSLRTWSMTSSTVERVQVFLKTDGRPLNANVDLWQGPDNTPQKMGIYIEDGNMRPFSAVIATPRGPNAIAIRNTGHLEFPLAACVLADVDGAVGDVYSGLSESSTPRTIQGGAIHTYPFDPSVSSVQVLLKTDGRPLNARIELLQGPNNNKQVMEIYTEDGRERPFYAVIETPGTGNVVRVVNTATVEFPMTANVEPYLIEQGIEDGGDSMFVVT